jgi:ubiquinone/menaquinone biosynthesis C-methylase UbiE
MRFCGEPDAFAWKFNIPAFLELVPPAGRLTLDIGCGEGRVSRVLLERGHRVKGFDASPTLVAAARAGDPPIDAVTADAAALPLEDDAADIAVAFMALQSIDDLEGAIAEAGRVLEPRGAEHAYADTVGSFTFHDVHRPLSQYTAALTSAGFVLADLREPIPGPELIAARPAAERWTRTPCFLHFRARTV